MQQQMCLHSGKSSVFIELNMSDFGELALVVGDFHIPHRAAGIPEKFQRMLVPNKMQRKNRSLEGHACPNN